MADQISKLHTELTVGTAGFAAGMQSAKAHVGGLGEEFHKVGNSLDRLGNRLDRQDISQGFSNISEAIGKASGAGQTFGTFVGQLGLGFATGGIAGAAFGGVINAINLGLESYNHNTEEAAKRTKELADALGRVAILREKTAQGGDILNNESLREELGKLYKERNEELAKLPKVGVEELARERAYNSIYGGSTPLQDSLRERDKIIDRFRTAEQDIINRFNPETGGGLGVERSKFGKSYLPGVFELPPVPDYVDERPIPIREIFGEDLSPLIGTPIREMIRDTVINPAVIRGSQADAELRARTDMGEEQTDLQGQMVDLLNEIAQNTSEGSESASMSIG